MSTTERSISIRENQRNRNLVLPEWLRWPPIHVALIALFTGAAAVGVLPPLSAMSGAEPGIARVGGSGFVTQVEPGAAVAFARQCAGCHDANGEGDFGPDLRTWAGSIEETTLLIANGSEGMPSFATTLTQDQIDALAAHVDELVGASAYREQCARCHGDLGEGATGPSLKTGMRDDADRRSLIADGTGSMPGFSDSLTDIEIDALVQRAAGYAAVGPMIFATQCAACHGAQGEGLSGPALVGSSKTDIIAIVEFGFGGMPAFGPTLEPGDIQAVVQYVVGLEPATPASSTTVTTTTTVTIAQSSGAEVYAQRCAICHGDDAEGGTGPPLAGTTLSADELTSTINLGQGSMPGLEGEVSPDVIAELVGFVEALAEPASGEPTGHGADVYAEQCAACHGADGRGLIGPSLRTTLLVGDALRDSIGRGNATMPAFSRTLDAEDLELVARYVEGLRASVESDGSGTDFVGGSGLYRQDCSACHGESGEGGIGPDLRGSALTVNEIIARIYGGHADGMPAFAGALDGRQVIGIADYVKTFAAPDEDKSRFGGTTILVVSGGLVLAVVVAAFFVRRRRREV